MATVPLEWRISQTGAESVKTRFQELKDQLDQGKISQEQYTKGVKDLRRELNDLNTTQNMNKRIFEASHPALREFGRISSAVGGVVSGLASGINTINLAILAFNGGKADILEQQNRVAQAQRNYTDAVREFGKDSPQAKDALGEWNVEQAKLVDLNANTKQEDINKMFAIATGIAQMGTAAATAAPKLAPYITQLASLTGILAGFVGGFIIEPLITNPGKDPFEVQNERTKKALENLQKFLNETYTNIQTGLLALKLVLTGIWDGIVDAFKTAWDALKSGFVAFWNGFATIANTAMKGIVAGIMSFINGIISAVEAALSALSRLTGGGGVSLPRVSIPMPQIPLIAAANGFNGMVNSPTLFLTGEAGPEHVQVTPGSSSVSTSNSFSNSASSVTNVYVAGSIRSDREVSQIVDRYQKRELGRRNFRPFG